jgi:hypothetical protein
MYLPEEPKGTREYWCEICGGTGYSLAHITLVQTWLRQWQEGCREAAEDIAKNGLPF